MAFFYITENVFYMFRSNFKKELSLISKNLKKNSTCCYLFKKIKRL